MQQIQGFILLWDRKLLHLRSMHLHLQDFSPLPCLSLEMRLHTRTLVQEQPTRDLIVDRGHLEYGEKCGE